MNPISPLAGAPLVGPQPRATGAEAASIAAPAGVQPASGDAVRAIEATGEADGGRIDRRAEDNRRARTAFEALRRSLGEDRVTLSDEGRRRAQAPAEVFERVFGAQGQPRGEGDGAGEARPDRPPRRFDDLFARPTRRPSTEARGAEDPEAVEATDEADETDEAAETDEADVTQRRSADGDPLTAEELEQVQKLTVRDAEVRTHEQAHKAVGGRYTGAISYDFQSGPDGKRYAVGGEVPIDISEVPNDPQATIRKMEIVRRAALAPAEPSGADRSAAAAAGQKAARARVELSEQQAEEAAEAREEAAGADEADADESAEARESADTTSPRGAEAPAPLGPTPPSAPKPAVDGGALRRIEPGTAGFFVRRSAPEAPAPDRPDPAPTGPAVASLEAATG